MYTFSCSLLKWSLMIHSKKFDAVFKENPSFSIINFYIDNIECIFCNVVQWTRCCFLLGVSLWFTPKTRTLFIRNILLFSARSRIFGEHADTVSSVEALFFDSEMKCIYFAIVILILWYLNKTYLYTRTGCEHVGSVPSWRARNVYIDPFLYS